MVHSPNQLFNPPNSVLHYFPLLCHITVLFVVAVQVSDEEIAEVGAVLVCSEAERSKELKQFRPVFPAVSH